MDKNAIEEILGDLETRLKAYLVEWRRELGIRYASEAGIVRSDRRPAATKHEKDSVETHEATSYTNCDEAAGNPLSLRIHPSA